MTRPVDAVIAVTYRCNARCAMCGIWRSPAPEVLKPEAYRALPSSLRDVNLTGGEPFLRDDLPDLHAAVRAAAPRAQTVISTNGLLTERIIDHVARMRRVEPALGLAISIDGPAEAHDRLRGLPGAYARAIRTLDALQSNGVRNLRLAFTLTPDNAEHFRAVYDLARARRVDFTCAAQHASEHYFQSDAAPSALATQAVRGQLECVIAQELRGFRPKAWGRAYFMHGIWEFVRGRPRLLPCNAGRDFFFLDPAGEIYTCNAMPFHMGNLRDGFPQAWRSTTAQDARLRADRCAPGCWMVCTARVAIKRSWPKALAWALRAKLRPGSALRP
jgi:MoaA/NifB/PqqE/SkfB family radical SAM enzyme